MCGIAGIVHFGARSVSRDLLERCCEVLSHRGPDGRGTWTHATEALKIGLAHTRLAVIDPDPEGNQPMRDASGRYSIVFNGLIYNYQELRDELSGRGYSFHTKTDTEVILNGFACWGDHVFDRLNGMWALCLFDQQSQQGLLCRDRFGIKPLVYSIHEDELAFSSEMSCLEQISQAPRNIWPVSLHQYLRFGYVAHPQTIYEHYHKLPPGCLLRFTRRGVSPVERYYHVAPKDQYSDMNYSDACSVVRRLIGESVARRRVSDVPLGAMLSGGLDSSIVVSHLAEASHRPVQTFCVGYEEYPQYDERRFARSVADCFATQHHEITLSIHRVVEALPSMLDELGEPFADASLVPTSLLSQEVRKHVTVALSGDGADELFGGYYRYLGHHFIKSYEQLPRWIRWVIEYFIYKLPVSKSSPMQDRVRKAKKLLRATDRDPLSRHFTWSKILSPRAEQKIDPEGQMPYTPNFEAFFNHILGTSLYEQWKHDPLNLILLMDLMYQLPSDMLLKVDQASMRHNLEVRVPMLDPAVVEFAASLPSSFKLQNDHRKKLLVDAYSDVLPPEVVNRSKMGFELPIGEFLRNELRGMFMDVVTESVVQDLAPLSHRGIMDLYEEHRVRRGEHADALYAILVLCWWKSRR